MIFTPNMSVLISCPSAAFLCLLEYSSAVRTLFYSNYQPVLRKLRSFINTLVLIIKRRDAYPLQSLLLTMMTVLCLRLNDCPPCLTI